MNEIVGNVINRNDTNIFASYYLRDTSENIIEVRSFTGFFFFF
jgi:hypothetical protein